jgi:hypothetical protein
MGKSIVHEWLKYWRENSDWRTWNTDAHGLHNHVFIDEQEEELVEEIIQDFIAPGRQFVNARFREITSRKFQSLGHDPAAFQCNNRFIQDFKICHRFSSRRFHTRHRQRIAGHVDIDEWVGDTTEPLATKDNRRVINCDEIAWCVVPNGLLMWTPIEEDSVSVYLKVNEKDAITVFANVMAAQEKLPLFFIAKWRTEHVEHNQLGDPSGHQTTHSASGWTKAETFMAYLE